MSHSFVTSAINLNNRMRSIWKDVVVILFKVLYQYLPRGTEEDHEMSEYPASGLRFEPGVFQYEAGVLPIQSQYSVSIFLFVV
jgi:hypothetical protein